MSMSKRRNVSTEKRKVRAAKKALYIQQARDKKERKYSSALGGAGFSPTKHKHIAAYCGNTGCARCFP